MLKCIFPYIILLAVAARPFTTKSQTSAPLPFKTLTVADGLPQSFVSGLVQDTQGFIWIGTRDGLARYDGIQYKLFNHVPGDTNTLAANVITSLWYDHHAGLWIVYESGDIDILNTITEVLFHFSRQPAYKAIAGKLKGIPYATQAIAKDGNGNIWLLANDGGVFIYNTDRRRMQFFSDTALGLYQNRVTGISARGPDILLVTDSALVTMNTVRQIISVVPYRFEQPHLFNARRSWKVTRPLIRSNGDIVIPDDNRLLLYQAATRSFTSWQLPYRKIYTGPCMTMDARENIYFDFSGAIYLLTTDNHLSVWQPPNTGLHRSAISMLFDRSGILWVGGNGSGISMFDLRLPHINGILYTDNFFTDVLQHSNKVPAAELQSSFIYSKNQYLVRHAAGPDGKIWFTLSGMDSVFNPQLCYVENHRLHTFSFGYPSPATTRYADINALAVSKKGVLWGIDYHFRPVRFNTDTKTVSVYPPLYPTDGCNDLLIDNEHIFWITTGRQGLFRYDLLTGIAQHMKQQDLPGQLPSGELLDMENDPYDSTIMWIGSMGGGLIRFDKTTRSSHCFTTKDGLPNNTVYAIMPDSRGMLWCSSNKGIFTFDPRTKEVRSFTTADGLLNDEFNRFHFIKLPDGRLSFGGVDSYTVFDPRAITEDDFQPRVVLTGLSINNEPADYGQAGSPFKQSLNSLQQVNLPFDRNFLSFRFAALEYNIPEKLQYRYRLAGIDEKWVYAKTGNTASYTGIPPGRYELQVNATNTSGKWSPYIKTIILVITPPFWKTWWFITVSIAAAALLIFVVIYSRVKSIRVKEKRQLQFDREVMELEAQALRAQMNPHFIFNCLNSIKLLIQEDKKQEAIIYLTTFSKLIRNQLSNGQKEISLAEELKTCRLYAQMEALRFGPGMAFEFTVEEPADIYSLMIPPLIIQPFIENAIWHGILPLETGGKVTIKITDRENRVQCIIDDDGIGREQSQKDKSGVAPAHPSKGMQLTQSRMHLYNLVHHRGGNITITDKKDPQGNALGTTVTISFKKEI